MKLRDAVKNGLASQQSGNDVYEVALISTTPINREFWSITKHDVTERIGTIIHQEDQLDNMIDFTDNHLGLDPNGWRAH